MNKAIVFSRNECLIYKVSFFSESLENLCFLLNVKIIEQVVAGRILGRRRKIGVFY
jgi:hypothetical protein